MLLFSVCFIFRFYDYEKSISEESIRNHDTGANVDPNGQTIKIARDGWQKLIGVMNCPPRCSSSVKERKAYEAEIMKALRQ